MSKEKIPVIAEAITQVADQVRLARMVRERRKYADEQAAAGAKKDELTTPIVELMSRYGAKAVQCGDYTATVIFGGKPTIVKERLLERGVDPEVIDYATQITSFTTVQIRKVSAGKRGRLSKEAVEEVA